MAYTETIERPLETKLSTFEIMFQNIINNIAFLNEKFNKNSEEVASIKEKQDAFSGTIGKLSHDNSQILEELQKLKQLVEDLSEKGNFSDDCDTEESSDDSTNEAEEVQESGCETPGPNKAQEGAVVCQEKLNPFKLGSLSLGDIFAVPQTTLIKPSSTSTPLTPSTNSPFIQPSTGGSSFVIPSPINLRFESSSENSPSIPSAQAASSTSVLPSKLVKGNAASGSHLPIDQQYSNNEILLASYRKRLTKKGVPSFLARIKAINLGNSIVYRAPTQTNQTKFSFDLFFKKEKGPTTEGSMGQDKMSDPFLFNAFASFSLGDNLTNPSFPFNSANLSKTETADIAKSNQGIASTTPTSSLFPNKTEPSLNTASNLGLFSSNTIKLKKDQKTGDGNEVGINGHMFDLSFSNSLIISNKKFEENRQKVEFKADKKEAQVLFDERGKLCHFVDGKWKERGAGNMEILKQKETNAFRLLMKREETLEVICSHAITEGLQLEPFQDSNKTLTWLARDFSEQTNDGLEELFALKFKTEELRRQFEGTVMDCIDKL